MDRTDGYDWTGNPIFGDSGQTLVSISSTPVEKPKHKSFPAAVGRIIGELGLRYRPSVQADLQAHAESIRLLCEDVADIPPHLLESAAKRWVLESKFMPKASELVALARGQLTGEIRGTDHGLRHIQAHCDRLNAMNEGRDGWHVVGEKPNRTIAKRDEERGIGQ